MRIKRLSILVLICAMLCSCFDYAQSISFNKGKYRCYYRIMVGNSLSAMGSLFGEQSDTNPEEIFKNFDGLTENLPECATVNKIQNASGTGIEIIMEIDPKHIDKNLLKEEEVNQVLPHYEGKKLFIPFLLGSQKDTYAGENDDSGMAAAMFSSAKCQIFLGKSVKKDVQASYFAGTDDILPIDCYDYGDSFCLDIPVGALLSQTNVDMNYLIVE